MSGPLVQTLLNSGMYSTAQADVYHQPSLGSTSVPEVTLQVTNPEMLRLVDVTTKLGQQLKAKQAAAKDQRAVPRGEQDRKVDTPPGVTRGGEWPELAGNWQTYAIGAMALIAGVLVFKFARKR